MSIPAAIQTVFLLAVVVLFVAAPLAAHVRITWPVRQARWETTADNLTTLGALLALGWICRFIVLVR